jgi:hypothetical protein
MKYPPYVLHSKPSEYARHFRSKYCQSSVTTFDGIEVSFHPSQFRHAFYTSRRGEGQSKTIFDFERAKRIDWIEAALKDRKAYLRQGFDTEKKIPRLDRRVCLVSRNYVVVIQLLKKRDRAVFITAFLANQRARNLILASPPWQK